MNAVGYCNRRDQCLYQSGRRGQVQWATATIGWSNPGLLNRPTKQIILAAGRAAGLPLELIHAGIAVMEGTPAKPAAVQPLLVNQVTAARLLSVSRFTIRRLIADGKLHPVQVRGALRYSREELERLAGITDGRR